MEYGNRGEVFEKKFLDVVAVVKRIALSCDSIEKSIFWGQLYGRLMSANYSLMVRDDDLERALVARYVDGLDFECNKNIKKELHVISEAYSTGGHTRLLERLVLMRPNCDVLVVKSGEGNLDVPEGVEIFFKKGGYGIRDLIKAFSGYKKIFLYIHPDDLLTSVAMGIVKRKFSPFVVFVNHADHIFSFGYYSADVVAEVSRYGFKLSTQRRNAECGFLGIPLELGGFESIPKRKFRDDLNIFSAGNSNKFKPECGYSFQSILNKILVAFPKVTVTIIGPRFITDWWWWLLKLRFWKKIRFLRSLPHEKYICEMKACDLYIDSYPMTGGTALPEIRSANILVTGVLCGSSGYTPFDGAKFFCVEDLISGIGNLFSKEENSIWNLNNDSGILRRAVWVHGMECVQNRLQALLCLDLARFGADELDDIDIDFYNRNWRGRLVVSLSAQDVLNLLKHPSGARVLGCLVFKFGFINFLSFIFLAAPRMVFRFLK